MYKIRFYWITVIVSNLKQNYSNCLSSIFDVESIDFASGPHDMMNG